MGSRTGEVRWLLAVSAVLVVHSGAAAPSDVTVVQCTIDKYRSSFSAQPDSFMIQVDIDARTITTYYGTMPLKMSRRQMRGFGPVSDGWQSNVAIDRNTGRLAAGVDKIAGRKYSYVNLQGTCILPPALRGAGYRPSAGS